MEALLSEVRLSHDRLSFVQSDWRRPLLVCAVAAAILAVLALLVGVDVGITKQIGLLAGFAGAAWLFTTRRDVHITPDQLEIVDYSNMRSQYTRRYPLTDIHSHALIEVNSRPVLRIDLPGRSLALPGERSELELAAALITESRQAYEGRDQGSQADIPRDLRQVASAAREGER